MTLRAAFLVVGAFFLAGLAQADPVLPVKLDVFNGFSRQDIAKAGQAAQLMSRIVSSDAFRQAVLEVTYDGKNQFANNELFDAKGNLTESNLTNERIYEVLMASRETYLNNVDDTAHLDVTLYRPSIFKKWGVVGYGYPGQPQIFMNQNYFNLYDITSVAGNLTHEWTHKLGFDHDYNRTPQRPFSVPYRVGCIVETLASGTPGPNCAGSTAK